MRMLGAMTETEVVPAGPGAAFAGLMAGAAEGERDPAPFGYTRDRATGEMRPKKSPGRGGKGTTPPPVEALKLPTSLPAPAESEDEDGAAAGPSPRTAAAPSDRAPDLRRPGKAGKPDAPLPPYKAGVITSGINKIYRKAGKLIRAGDRDIGEAFIDAARNTADIPGEDDSVGAAWDALAKSNPRIRRFLLKALAGGALSDLLIAHGPIALAIVMKPAIRNRLPLMRIAESMAEPDEDAAEGEGGLPGGMTLPDLESIRQLAEQQAAAMGIKIPDHVAEGMAAMANGAPPPAAFTRHQPRRSPSRAQRRG